MRVFSSFDDTRFSFGFSTGSKGDKIFTTSKVLDSSDGFYNSWINGTAGELTATTGLADGTYNLPCDLVQSQGATANILPNLEKNFLINVASGVAHFRYVLTRTFTNPGAQIVTANDYRTIIVDPGVVLTVPEFNGQFGGFGLLWAKYFIRNKGLLTAAEKGFQGSGNDTTGREESVARIGERGAGWFNTDFARLVSLKDNGAGGPGYDTNDVWNGGHGGNGGSNRTPGGIGGKSGGGNQAVLGNNPGQIAGEENCRIMLFGGCGSQGGMNDGNNNATATSSGTKRSGGCWDLVTEYFDNREGEINVDGGNGIDESGQAYFQATGGGSAAGCIRGTVIRADLGNKLYARGGRRGFFLNDASHLDRRGANAGDGYVHFDFGLKLTHTNPPYLHTRRDSSLIPPGPLMVFL